MLYISQVSYTTCFGIISLPSSGVSIEEFSSHRPKGLLIVYRLKCVRFLRVISLDVYKLTIVKTLPTNLKNDNYKTQHMYRVKCIQFLFFFVLSFFFFFFSSNWVISVRYMYKLTFIKTSGQM
jgi:hypothetical protein